MRLHACYIYVHVKIMHNMVLQRFKFLVVIVTFCYYSWTSCDLFSPCWFFFPFMFISWRLITLQYCSGFRHTLTWISHGFTCVPHPEPPLPPPSPSHPSGLSQCTSPEHLSHASNLAWRSVSMLIYMYLISVFNFSCMRLQWMNRQQSFSFPI